MSIVGPGSPYVSPSILLNAPTGISWNTIPTFKSTPQQQYTEALNLANRASAALDSYCQTALRATVNTETVYGPGDHRCALQDDGTVRLILSRPPITQIIGGSVRPRSSPPGTSTRPLTASNLWPERPVMSVYGTSAPGAVADVNQAVILQPGFIGLGRMSNAVTVTYVNGYPHSALTANYSAGASSIHVDDITGMVGAFCTFYSADDSLQESATVLTVTPDTVGAISGPGTLTLNGTTANNHVKGDLFTTIPASIQQACILMAASMALVRGGTATSVQTMPGTGINAGGSGQNFANEAEIMVHPYRRVW